jgi:predicted metalloendopeptidase
MKRRSALLAVLVLLALAIAPAALAQAAGKPAASSAAAAASPSPAARSVLATMDPKADPCVDFYRYACGGWLDSTRIPPDQSRWGRGFTEIAERNRLVLRDILEAAAKAPKNDDERKVGTFYASCMEEAKIEELGTKPLEPMLKEIATVKDGASLMTVAGKMQALTYGPLFGLGVEADFKNPNVNMAMLIQGGIGLPDRDYYLKDDERSVGLRIAYEQTVAKMLQLAGDTPEAAAAAAKSVVGFETELSKFSRERAALRDVEKLYNKTDMAGLQKMTPGLPWSDFLAAAAVTTPKDVNVATPEFFEELARLAAATPPATLQNYLRWNLVRGAAPRLPKAFVDQNFEFYGKTLAGQKELQARWKRCVAATDGAMPEILGKLFVEKQFAGASKKTAKEMILAIEESFGVGLGKLSWMDEATAKRAAGKLATLVNKVGYPDKWVDYGKLEVKAGDYFGNAQRADVFEFRRAADKIGKPVDRTEWGMSAPTVNAYYNPLWNEMVFPAGILQPPFFDASFPMAMNFGGIGMVVGHELTHGYDDEGRKFAPDGQLKEWWEPAVSEKFDKQAACIDELYSGFEVQPGVKLNGKLTLGENIADFGGLKYSYRAYKDWAKKNPSSTPAVPGLTDDQLFFVGFAQTWCTLATPEIERVLANVDPHSPPRFRVNGPVSNTAEFAAAFQCKAGTPMNPEKTCSVW